MELLRSQPELNSLPLDGCSRNRNALNKCVSRNCQCIDMMLGVEMQSRTDELNLWEEAQPSKIPGPRTCLLTECLNLPYGGARPHVS